MRVLIAKDAISTGWDCPRAEVMVSFSTASDRTHITQLLGRMVRTPLARRIPGNERLNSVECLLPKFNTNTVRDVVNTLFKGDDASPPERTHPVNPVEMKPNPAASTAVWEVFEALPSQTRPQKEAKPARRLAALAQDWLMMAFLMGQSGKPMLLYTLSWTSSKQKMLKKSKTSAMQCSLWMVRQWLPA
ncbi:hypothetical protein ILX21_003955 [Salmonella enterica]|nr:hypothetical protein [Salmonella enterica]EDQ0314421.1 hypothetical protein [Salmonella enterica subsp. enterica serovar Berta]EDR6293770.1 hypothetical protein [Salmonella enterica subsp. enterica serovar Pensacola]ECO9407182.1 hypothetical protein [Salmonella enterica]EGM0803645.1 hypothetical protein [Salmonella enterica]